MSLPYFQTSVKELSLLETSWKSKLDPIIANPITNMSILKNVQLIMGTNVINHLLGVTQQGWIIVDQQGPGNVYRSAPFNNLTLTLTSSAAVLVSIGVF